MQTRLASYSEICLPLPPNIGIKGVCHHRPTKFERVKVMVWILIAAINAAKFTRDWHKSNGWLLGRQIRKDRLIVRQMIKR